MNAQASLFTKLETMPLPVVETNNDFLDRLLLEYQEISCNIHQARSQSQLLVLSLDGKPGNEYDLNTAFEKLETSLYEDCVHSVANHYAKEHGLKLDVYKYIAEGKAFVRENVLAWVGKTTGGKSLEQAALKQLQDTFTFGRYLPVTTKTTVVMKSRVSYSHPMSGTCFNYGSNYGSELEELVHFLNTASVVSRPRQIFEQCLSYDPYVLGGPVVTSLQLFKNGNVKLTFANEQGVQKFLSTFVNN